MIKIAHLYYDLMNLYGDNGNIKILKQALENQGISTSIEFLSVDDKINFDDFDIIYIGPGTYNNEKIVLKNILKYKNDIQKAINNNVFFLITGNALDLFGKEILDDNSKIEGLGIFEFNINKTMNRLVGEVYVKSNNLNDYILGFKNQDSILETKMESCLKIVKGYGFDSNSPNEGLLINNFFGTFLIGPLLVRNPELLIFLVKKIIDSKYDNFKYKPFNLDLEQKAHDEYIKNYFDKDTN